MWSDCPARSLYGDIGVLADVNNEFADAISNSEGLHFFECDLTYDDIPYREEFDLVVLCEVVEHMIHPLHEILEKILHAIKPGGRIFITTPNLYRLRNCVRMLTGGDLFCPLIRVGRGKGIGHPFELTVNNLTVQLLTARFEVEDIRLEQYQMRGVAFNDVRWIFLQMADAEIEGVPLPNPLRFPTLDARPKALPSSLLIATSSSLDLAGAAPQGPSERADAASALPRTPPASRNLIGTAPEGAELEAAERTGRWIRFVDPVTSHTGWIYEGLLEESVDDSAFANVEQSDAALGVTDVESEPDVGVNAPHPLPAQLSRSLTFEPATPLHPQRQWQSQRLRQKWFGLVADGPEASLWVMRIPQLRSSRNPSADSASLHEGG
jgi:hypothetical protein